MIDSLKWRYACKAYDASHKISDADWQLIEESLVLTPSSFGLQPWKFFVIKTPDIREELVAHSWGQRQVADASHFIVFAQRRGVDEAYVDKFMTKLAEVQKRPPEELTGYKGAIMGFISQMDAESMAAWTQRQTYIALGQLMTVAAKMRIDATPMEGLVPAEYDRILGFENTEWQTSVACALGYRSNDDKYASSPKTRWDATDVIEHI